MGIEYSIEFSAANSAEVENIIDTLNHCQHNSKYSSFELRKTVSSEGMPDATIHLISGGLYFSDNGGYGQEFLGKLIAKIVSNFGVVTIQEIE